MDTETELKWLSETFLLELWARSWWRPSLSRSSFFAHTRPFSDEIHSKKMGYHCEPDRILGEPKRAHRGRYVRVKQAIPRADMYKPRCLESLEDKGYLRPSILGRHVESHIKK